MSGKVVRVAEHQKLAKLLSPASFVGALHISPCPIAQAPAVDLEHPGYLMENCAE